MLGRVGKGWLGVTRIYERSYFTRLTNRGDSLLARSAEYGREEEESEGRSARCEKDEGGCVQGEVGT